MAKQTSQNFRLGDSYMNLIVGIIVVVAIGALIIGLIRGRDGSTPSETGDNQQQQEADGSVSLPTKHTVAEGEDLWKISEKYYKSGYNWVDIAQENNIVNPNAIAAGQELNIPNVAPRATEAGQAQEAQAAPTSAPAPTEVVALVEPTVADTKGEAPQVVGEAISGGTYTVAKGDYLWNIALRAYGDGYKWVEIARANKLVNPNIIHTGNVLTLPR